jgi:hypothetical protein
MQYGLRDYISAMVALKPVPQVVRCVVEGRWSAQPCVNVFHIMKTTPVSAITQPEIDNLAIEVRGNYQTRFLPLMDDAFTLGNVICTDLTSNTSFVGVATGQNPGAKVGTGLPANVALVVSWEIGRRYRGGHPRSYFPGMVTADQSGLTQWVSATLTAWDTAAGNFLLDNNAFTGTGASTWSMCAVHREFEKQPLTNPIVSHILGAHVDSRIDTMRRRLGRPPS